MTAAREIEQLRRARTLFERAQRDGVSMGEARRRMHQDRWQRISGRLTDKAAASLCGTAAPAIADDVARLDGEFRLQWWQQ
jgi:hypothetical protein